VLGYLARYTHRVAITNHRLVAFTNQSRIAHAKPIAPRVRRAAPGRE
jgi:hypothetical protein